MSPARAEGLRLLGGMLTVEPGTGREGGTSFHSAQLFNAGRQGLTKSSLSGTNVVTARAAVSNVQRSKDFKTS